MLHARGGRQFRRLMHEAIGLGPKLTAGNLQEAIEI
jgi:hypothetical protein